MRRPLALFLAASALGVLSTSCAALSTDLRTAEARYDEARYTEAEVWLEDLEARLPSMDSDEQARFYFLRGMTAYRLGQRDEALHYLALAHEVTAPDRPSPGRLPDGWQATLASTLEQLVPDGATHHARPAPVGDEA